MANKQHGDNNLPLFWVLLLVILAGYIIVQISLIPGLPLTYNEGVTWQVSRLISQGYQPYIQIFTLAAPLFVWFVGWLGQFELALGELKLIFFLFSLLLLVNVSIITRAIFGWQVALATVFLLATTTTFLAEAATAIIAVTPAISIASLTLVFTVRYLAKKGSLWIFLAGVVWGVSLFLSMAGLSIGLAAIIFIIFFDNALLSTPGRRRSYKSITILLGGMLAALAIGIIWVTPGLIFDDILKDYITLATNLPLSQADKFTLFGQFMAFNLALFLFAAYTLVQIYDDANHPVWAIFVWGMVSFLWLMAQTPLHSTDFTVLLPPLTIMAGWGAMNLGQHLARWSSSWPIGYSTQRLLQRAGALLLLVSYAWLSWLWISTFNLREVDTPDNLIQLAQRSDVANFVRQHTSVQDCVIVDDAALAVALNRLPAPPLAELSPERIASGLITQEAIISLVQEHTCKAVIFSKRRYSRPLSDFKSWAENYYPNHKEFTRTDIYYQ